MINMLSETENMSQYKGVRKFNFEKKKQNLVEFMVIEIIKKRTKYLN